MKLGVAVHTNNPRAGCRAEAGKSLGLFSLLSSLGFRFSERSWLKKNLSGVTKERHVTSTSGFAHVHTPTQAHLRTSG